MLETIKELRAKTHLGLTECKKALEATNGDIDLAIEFLQKQGSIKKADQVLDSKEGVVRAVCLGFTGAIIEVNCETDFAAKSELFNDFVDSCIYKLKVPKVVKNRLDVDWQELHSQEKLNFISKQLGEQVKIKRFDFIESPEVKSGCHPITVPYNHHNNKLSVLLHADYATNAEPLKLMDYSTKETEVLEFVKNCAMQIAANNPVGLSKNDPKVIAELEKQKPIFEQQVPEKSLKNKDKIVEGKIKKWYSENVLECQECIWEPKKTVEVILKELSDKNGAIELKSFIRYQLGE